MTRRSCPSSGGGAVVIKDGVVTVLGAVVLLKDGAVVLVNNVTPVTAVGELFRDACVVPPLAVVLD